MSMFSLTSGILSTAVSGDSNILISNTDNIYIMLACALGLAAVVALTYYFTHRKVYCRTSLVISLLVLSPIATLIMIIVGSSLARAVSIGGGFLLIRYRNTLDDPLDLAYIFLAMGSGMACGLGCILFSAVTVVALCLLLTGIYIFRRAKKNGADMRLHILIPENLDYYGIFDEIMSSYCSSCVLEKIKTTDYGTLMELTYRIRMKDATKNKALIDEIRCRNGNMNVTLVTHALDA